MLPDGWYGRPFDNLHHLTSVSELQGGVEVRLDGNDLLLRFKKLVSASSEGQDLVLAPFEELTFEATSRPSSKRSYTAGEVRFKGLALG